MRAIVYGVALASLMVVAGCQETSRPLSFEKGTYRGKADTELTKEQVDALRQRGMRIAE